MTTYTKKYEDVSACVWGEGAEIRSISSGVTSARTARCGAVRRVTRVATAARGVRLTGGGVSLAALTSAVIRCPAAPARASARAHTWLRYR